MPFKNAGKARRQVKVDVESLSGYLVVSFDVTEWVGISDIKLLQVSELGFDPDGVEARTPGMNAANYRQKVVGRMRTPSMRIRAGIARHLWPGTEAQWQQFAPGTE